MHSVWITVAPIVVINFITVITFVIFLTRMHKIPSVPDMVGRHQSKFLSKVFHSYWYWLTDPLVKFFVKIRLSPNMLTMVGFLISCGAAVLFARGEFGYAGWTVIVGATCDMFDGRVARLTGQSTRSGAFFDSVMDRFGEAVVFFGLAYFYRDSWMMPVSILALIGSTMVSYARARGEGVGVVCKKGLMQRPERIAYLSIASVLQPVADVIFMRWYPQSAAVLVMGSVSIIALLTIYTAAYRTIFIMDALDSADRARDGEDTLPQILTKLSTRAGRESLRDLARYGYARGQARFATCVLFVVDGMHGPTFKRLLKKGALPNISRHLIESGTFTDAVSVFPSTAGPASTPLVTGCFPGTCNIPGVRWFDRSVPPHKRFTLKRFRDYAGWGGYAIDFDLAKDVKTIYEYSRQAVNLLGQINRGAGLRRDPAFLRSPQWLHGDRHGMEEVEHAVFHWFTQALHRQPDFIYYYFPSIDRAVRVHGLEHVEVEKAYRRLDRYVGDAVDLLKTHGLFEHTALSLTGDYGHGEKREQFDLDEFVSRRFRNSIVTGATSFRNWLEAEAISLVSGNGMANVYFREARSWSRPRLLQELAPVIPQLLEQPAVDLLLGRAPDGGVVVQSQRGLATIHESAHIEYVVHGGDPFGYRALPARMSRSDALQFTQDSAYPDGIVQALQLFRSARAGDVVVSATPGFSLGNEFTDPYHSTHGSLHRSHLMVPCAISVPLALQSAMRTADIFPTLLQFAGLTADHAIDGSVVGYAV